MSRNEFVVVALCCALMLAAPASATEFFWDDFNDNDMSDWTDLSLTVQPFRNIACGHYGGEVRGEDPGAGTEARSVKPLSNTSLSDTVHISFDVSHTGGYKIQGGTGQKTTRLWFLNDNGVGYGLSASMNKEGFTGQIDLLETTDWAVSSSYRGGDTFTWGAEGRHSYAEYTIEAVYDRGSGAVELYIADQLVGQIMLDTTENDSHKDFTNVLLNPSQTYSGSAGYLTSDSVWIGDESNPHWEPILSGPGMPIWCFGLWVGDTDGNLKSDIVDLTALAANWSALSPGLKDWTEGNFNMDTEDWNLPGCDWVVDIQDLTGVAANWSFVGSAPPVPEPATLALLAIGGIAVFSWRHRRA